MKKINETKTLSDLINSTLFSENFSKEKVNLFVKYSTIFSFWEEIVGKKFFEFTVPYDIKKSKLYVSTKSPVITQELQMHKDKIIKKINSYSMPLGIEIKSIQYDYKNFSKITSDKKEEFIEDKPVWYNTDNLSNSDEKEETLISNSIKNLKFLSKEQKEKFIEKAIYTNRAKNLRKNSNNM